jgi:hypothetical protein
MRLIDADALKERAIRLVTVKYPNTYFKGVGTREIDKAPTIEAEPVRHGEWIDTGIEEFGLIYSGYKCSQCGFILYGNQTKYCPNCGAKMDGGSKWMLI